MFSAMQAGEQDGRLVHSKNPQFSPEQVVLAGKECLKAREDLGIPPHTSEGAFLTGFISGYTHAPHGPVQPNGQQQFIDLHQR